MEAEVNLQSLVQWTNYSCHLYPCQNGTSHSKMKFKIVTKAAFPPLFNSRSLSQKSQAMKLKVACQGELPALTASCVRHLSKCNKAPVKRNKMPTAHHNRDFHFSYIMIHKFRNLYITTKTRWQQLVIATCWMGTTTGHMLQSRWEQIWQKQSLPLDWKPFFPPCSKGNFIRVQVCGCC